MSNYKLEFINNMHFNKINIFMILNLNKLKYELKFKTFREKKILNLKNLFGSEWLEQMSKLMDLNTIL